MKSCFVCMPLVNELREIYYDAILPEIRDATGGPWKCGKADDYRLPGMVSEKIVQFILNADLVIAVAFDLRDSHRINPNVMYELGVAHSFRKPTIVVVDRENTLPFDLQGVECIELNLSRFRDEGQRPVFLGEFRRDLRRALKSDEILDCLEKKKAPLNPITTQLAGTRIFVEDLTWLWGYGKVLLREREAKTIWEITQDLFWPGESLFFESLRTAIRDEKKHLFMIPDDEGVLRRADAIRKELREYLPAHEIDRHLHFVALEKRYFALWPIAVVLYDADLARGRGGIICEPMNSEVGKDAWDEEFRERFAQHSKPNDLEDFLKHIDWVFKRREATFDVLLDGRVVDALATSFSRIWNERIREEARQKANESEQTALLDAWLIRG